MSAARNLVYHLVFAKTFGDVHAAHGNPVAQSLVNGAFSFDEFGHSDPFLNDMKRLVGARLRVLLEQNRRTQGCCDGNKV